MSEAKIGYSTIVKLDENAGVGAESLVTLEEVFEVTPPEASVATVDATHMASPNRAKEFVSGLIDNGSASIQGNYVPNSTTDNLIRDLQAAGSETKMEITFPNGVKVSCQILIENYSQSVPVEDRMTFTVSFKVTGATTLSIL